MTDRANLGRHSYTPDQVIPDDHFPAWLSYIRLVGDVLGLSHVRVTLYHTPVLDGCDAKTKHMADSNLMFIWLSGSFEVLTPEQQRRAIVHEWCHYLAAMISRPYTMLQKTVGPLMWEPLAAAAYDSEEQSVDLMGRAMEAVAPLPDMPWPQAKDPEGWMDMSPPDQEVAPVDRVSDDPPMAVD